MKKNSCMVYDLLIAFTIHTNMTLMILLQWNVNRESLSCNIHVNTKLAIVNIAAWQLISVSPTPQQQKTKQNKKNQEWIEEIRKSLKILIHPLNTPGSN